MELGQRSSENGLPRAVINVEEQFTLWHCAFKRLSMPPAPLRRNPIRNHITLKALLACCFEARKKLFRDRYSE